MTLTIAPGATVKASGTALYVNGTMKAVGTSGLPILFPSRSASPGQHPQTAGCNGRRRSITTERRLLGRRGAKTSLGDQRGQSAMVYASGL